VKNEKRKYMNGIFLATTLVDDDAPPDPRESERVHGR
jgi:hypothetical protein